MRRSSSPVPDDLLAEGFRSAVLEFLEKTGSGAATGSVIYRSKMHLVPKRNFQVMPGAGWLELLLGHVPDRAPGTSPAQPARRLMAPTSICRRGFRPTDWSAGNPVIGSEGV